MIDDTTIDYGADTVTVTFGSYDVSVIDEGLTSFATRIQPGRHRAHLSAVREGPDRFEDRLEHHLRYLIDLVYAVIEPARLNALRGKMWRLTLGKPDDQRIRERSPRTWQGPTATALSSIAMAEGVDVGQALQELEELPTWRPVRVGGCSGPAVGVLPGPSDPARRSGCWGGTSSSTGHRSPSASS